jgi:hypothetical protein
VEQQISSESLDIQFFLIKHARELDGGMRKFEVIIAGGFVGSIL